MTSSETPGVTLLFTDLVGSTELLHRLGDDEAEELRRIHFALLRQAVAVAGGREVKNLGDGLMVAFSDPAGALSCAVAIQQASAVHNQSDPKRPLHVRIGVHTGAAVEEGGDYFGRAVVVASRLCASATGGEILASEVMRALAGDEFRFSPLARLHLKGVPEPVPSVAVAWREGEVAPPSARRPQVGLPGNAFVGREAQLLELASLIEDARLVTLTGAGGIGKSRFALHLAARVSDRYPDGVFLCELASLTDPDEVDLAVASALRVEEAADRSASERIVEFLHTKRVLLVMDNCEHVLPAVASLASAVLRNAPDVDLVATSRERLGIEGEHRVPIGALPIPIDNDPLSPAVTLFADRAAAARPEFDLTSHLAEVCELCRRLDGMPLAIELAASRCVARSPAEVLAEITDRFEALVDSRRAVGRHRSIDAVVGWSHDHLGPAEQEVFQRVSVFVGGFTAPAAAAVVGEASEDVVRDLTSLVEQSLVTAHELRGRTRFSMLEPVRQHAEARLRDLGLLDQARGQHARWAVGWVEEADAGLQGADEGWWGDSLEEEFANLRAAHRWCMLHRPGDAVRIVASLFWWAYSGGPSEIYAWAADTIDGSAHHPRLPLVFATAALGAWRRGDLEGARVLAGRAIDLAAGEESARYAWQILGNVELLAGDFERAIGCYDQAIALARRAGDSAEVVSGVGTRAMCLAFTGQVAEARAELDALTGAIESPGGQAWRDYVAGEIEREIDLARALTWFRSSLDSARRGRSRFMIGVAGLAVLSCAARLGEPVDIGDYAELIEHWQRAGSWSQQWITIRVLLETLASLGHDEAAAVLYGGLVAAKTASPVVGSDAERLAQSVAGMQTRLGEDAFLVRKAEGAALGDDRVVAHALDFVRAAG
jgi:predicted ATPase/class 3 adenylate cyclase